MADPASTHHDEFYLRYYVGHRGPFGHEFMEFEVYPSGKLQYANHSKYDDNSLIRKEVYLGPAVVEEMKRIIQSSGVLYIDDRLWKEPSEKDSRQELECKIGSHHIAFTACEIGSSAEIQKSSDPDGLRTFYYLTQDLKALVLTIVSIHFKARPIPITTR